MSGTRWCQGACVSGPGPVLELSGCLSHPVLCNRGLHVSSLQRRASLCTLSGGPPLLVRVLAGLDGEEPVSTFIAEFICL